MKNHIPQTMKSKILFVILIVCGVAFSGCTFPFSEKEEVKVSPQVPEKTPTPLLTGDPKTIYEPVRLPGTENEELITVVSMQYADYEKIKDRIEVIEVIPNLPYELLDFSNISEMLEFREKHKDVVWKSERFLNPNLLCVCRKDYSNIEEDLSQYTLKKSEPSVIRMRIKTSSLKNIPSDIVYRSMEMRSDNFLLRMPPYSLEETIINPEEKCFKGMSLTEAFLYSPIRVNVYDPTLYSLLLPSELVANTIGMNEKGLYLIKLRVEPLQNREAVSVDISSTPHKILDYDLTSNTSPHSLIIVSTTEEEILKAKAQGVVWWYERYHPAYKMDVRELYKNRPSYSIIYEEKYWLSVQITVSMPEGITAETAAKKREELQKFAEGLGAVKPVTLEKYEGGAIVGFFDSYYDRKQKVFGLGVPKDDQGKPIEYSDHLKENFKKLQTVEPRSELAIDWEKYKGQDTFHFLIPAIPQEAIIDLLKREDVLTGDMKYVTYPYGGKNINLF
jgi:hypothetical protein